ncbi:hypothetical protein IFM89_000095 [Coptis chinensis]|uniref:Uncharacterized protein n=1 Tax=Coptis chinensis TaxID=261450 RepID=A0A835LTP1_9MAGN|nr:hypothetical protein IFM89_000095 [Coptis chinensis]
MGWGALRNIIVRPLTRSIFTHSPIRFPAKISNGPFVPPASQFDSIRQSLLFSYKGLHSLTETRYPKRRPGFTNRKKRTTIKPPGPYALVQHTPQESILANKPHEGSVKNRNANEKKRIAQRKAFIKSEAKKRKVLVQEAKKKKRNRRIERKMAAVARDRAWAQRLAELQKLEAEAANTA